MTESMMMEYPAPQDLIVEHRKITDVRLAEDGWSVEVEDPRGIRLTYWVAGADCVPHVGDTARFYGGAAGQPLRGLDINDCRVFLDAPGD